MMMMMMMMSRGRGYPLVETIQDYSGYITKTECNIIVLLYTEQKNSHDFVSSLMASNTKHANLAWLPLEIIHHGHYMAWLLVTMSVLDMIIA